MTRLEWLESFGKLVVGEDSYLMDVNWSDDGSVGARYGSLRSSTGHTVKYILTRDDFHHPPEKAHERYNSPKAVAKVAENPWKGISFTDIVVDDPYIREASPGVCWSWMQPGVAAAGQDDAFAVTHIAISGDGQSASSPTLPRQ